MEAVALSLELTRLASSAFRYVFLAWEVISFRPVRYHYSDLKKRFGGFQALLLIAIFPDARQIVHRIERHVLDTEEEEALVLRKSTSEDCTMLAVAAAIVAQVAITALGLEKIDQVHWTAKAAFTVSLSTGGLSVFYACLVQQRMSSLFTTDDVKDFFSRPGGHRESQVFERELDLLIKQLKMKTAGEESTWRQQKLAEIESLVKLFRSGNRWKSASFHSILMVKAPTILLKYALATFIIGLGIYLGCLAFNGEGTPGGLSLKIFTVYLVTSFLSLLIYYIPATLKDLELSPSRRYVQVMNKIIRNDIAYGDETQILENITRLLNADN